jgi:ribosomal protein L37AE/L43A
MDAEPLIPETPETSSEVAQCEACGATDWMLMRGKQVAIWACNSCDALYDAGGGRISTEMADALFRSTASKGEN